MSHAEPHRVRAAERSDIPAIERLIARSVRELKHGADELLDPAREPARIRAFFVHPTWSRRGFGRVLFDICLRDARAAGFRRIELMATMPGEPLYRALGFTAEERIELALPDGVPVALVKMSRPID